MGWHWLGASASVPYSPPESPSVPMCTVTTRHCHLALICSDLRRGWAGLDWVGLGWAGLGWTGLAGLAGLGAATGKWIFSWGPEAHNQRRLDLVTVAAKL